MNFISQLSLDVYLIMKTMLTQDDATRLWIADLRNPTQPEPRPHPYIQTKKYKIWLAMQPERPIRTKLHVYYLLLAPCDCLSQMQHTCDMYHPELGVLFIWADRAPVTYKYHPQMKSKKYNMSIYSIDYF